MRMKRPTAAVLTVLAAATLAGCGNEPDAPGVKLDPGTSTTSSTQAAAPTSSSAATSPTPTKATAPTEQQKIIQAYRAYYAASARAGKTATSDPQAVLAPYATGPMLTTAVRSIKQAHKRGQIYYGQQGLRPQQPRIENHGQRAVIRDCQNTAGSGLKSVKTGQRVTVGYAQDSAEATLVKQGGRWKVYKITSIVPAGAYCS